MEEKVEIGYFNINDGESVPVRLLHHKTEEIEQVTYHIIEVDGKKKKVKCFGEDCPLCREGATTTSDYAIHFIDYRDGKEKVWSRFETAVKQFKDIEASWGDLSQCVIAVKRTGKQYTYNVVPPQSYPPVPQERIGIKVGYMTMTNRTKEDLEQYIKTGILPEKKPYMSKEEWMKANKQNNVSSVYKPNVATHSVNENVPNATTFATANEHKESTVANIPTYTPPTPTAYTTASANNVENKAYGVVGDDDLPF